MDVSATQFTKHYQEYRRGLKEYKGKLSSNVLRILESVNKSMKGESLLKKKKRRNMKTYL